ncbi:DUF4215 domain-containing protein, partial [Myxococcota bacterium]|nr:DUF4215 domain-containing protein [Myxococcota bacterium]
MARIKQTFLIVVAFFLVSCAEGNPEAECGNGVLEMGEGCDDGNKRNNDSCPDGEGGTCQPARCGDGFLWNDYGGGEQCEDGNTQNYDGCNSICQLEALCGNGTIDPGETCD